MTATGVGPGAERRVDEPRTSSKPNKLVGPGAARISGVRQPGSVPRQVTADSCDDTMARPLLPQYLPEILATQPYADSISLPDGQRPAPDR